MMTTKITKKMIGIIAICGFMSAPAIFAAAPIPSDSQKDVVSLSGMLEKVTPTVVNVAVAKETPNKPNMQQEESTRPTPPKLLEAVGSGVIYDEKKGLIITNAHVVQQERIILVTLKDGRRFRATLVGKDEGFDIAIIRIPPINLTSITFGDSDLLKVGDFVAAIGSPFGFTQTVTSGMISALNREQPQIEGFQSFIQTDAPINPGNSGGALVNMQGELIGINTAMFTPTYANIGIGFAIPSNMVNSVVEQLLKYGKVSRGMLGVYAQDISPELADALDIEHEKGILVTQIIQGSPAEKAGFKEGDIIEKLNNKPLHSAAQLRNTLGVMRPGTKIYLQVTRNHKSIQLSATVGNPNTMLAANAAPFIGGLRLQNFSELLPSGQPLKGIIVTDVADTSPGALAGLQAGDVITSANNEEVDSTQQLVEIAKKSRQRLLVKVNRNNTNLYLVLQNIQ